MASTTEELKSCDALALCLGQPFHSFSENRPLEMQIKRVLCVDDDATTLEVRRLLLGDAGYSVATASSGAETLEIIADGNDFDLVLLDYAMPSMNGDELAEELRKRRPHLRLMAVSAVGQLPPKFLHAVDGSVQKGQSPEVLLSAMAAVLDQPSAKNVAKQLAPPTVLCVDDDRSELLLRRMLFESAGFLALQARSADEALEIFRSKPVDAVVMDYWLSGTNGTAVAEEMKRLYPRIPIVMLSGFSSLPGEGMLVDAWLRKAETDPEHVVDEVKRLIRLRTKTQETAIS